MPQFLLNEMKFDQNILLIYEKILANFLTRINMKRILDSKQICAK